MSASFLGEKAGRPSLSAKDERAANGYVCDGRIGNDVVCQLVFAVGEALRFLNAAEGVLDDATPRDANDRLLTTLFERCRN